MEYINTAKIFGNQEDASHQFIWQSGSGNGSIIIDLL